ncbi:MAG: carbohydrate ABC transporter permease [Nonomuraea sp.]|nr:carbohydrate ABC transporter permease [Nonomuraea sp.]NUP83209.1 carbohydrate ABC transporter permease [Nonomuraea sp.]NUS03422.1 carbohydrate ABC transporter permease [Nonomuraea sp.]NUT10656.1 carbohydrate ABC transporter permease [Nonomuraea sp.]
MIRRTVLVVLGLIWLGPTYLLVVNASRPAASYDPGRAWVPSGDFALLENFGRALESADLGASLASSALYAIVSPLLGVVIGALAGYTIVVLRLRHGFWWFLLIFGGTVFPSQMLLVPLFVGYSDAGLYDTRLGMILIYTGINVPLAAFVLRNFYTGVAFSIFEAARMDGASTWRIFWRIYLPISLSALTAVFILEFTFIWNDLVFGLTLTQTESVRPVMTALAGLMTDVYAGTPVPVGLAAGLVVSLPTVALFLATQRLFARGLSLGSV